MNFRICICRLSCLLAGLLLPSWVTAHEELRGPMLQVAKVVQSVLKKEGADTVAVGEFTGPPTLATASSSGFQKILSEELTKLGVRVKKVGANFGVQGKFSLTNDTELKVEITLSNAQGEELSALNTKVAVKDPSKFLEREVDVNNGKFDISQSTSSDLFGNLAGATVDLEARRDKFFSDRRDRPDDPNLPRFYDEKEVIRESFAKPTAFVSGTMVKSSRNSRFGVELYVNGQPRPITLEDGHPYVQLKKQEVFEIRLRNDAPFETAATIHLDGINAFAFSEIRFNSGLKEGQPRYTRYIMAPSTENAIKGWFKNNQQVEEFKVTDFSESAAAKLGSKLGLGTVTVVFRATWKVGTNPPQGEPPRFSSGGLVGSSGIGFGKKVEQKTLEDVETREYGEVRSIVTIRYERQN